MKFPAPWLFASLLLALVPGLSGQPFGLSNRVGVTTIKLPLTLPVNGYVATNAFGSVAFTNPIVIRTPLGETNRVFVAEQRGRIMVITNLTAPTRTLFLDISSVVNGGVPNDEQGLLGFAFHPGYATNGYFYVYYTLTATTEAGTGRHQRLARYQVSAHPSIANAASASPILTMFDEASNHNGGDIHFGADGYLYLSLGDEGDANDTRSNSQRLDKDFWAGILRLDVDNRPDSLEPNPHPAIAAGTYKVPADNPYIGVTNWYGSNLVAAKVRTEFYAIGLRNPWRMSFDPPTGRLYCADVGQGAREEIDIIVRGGNYGWNFREGLIARPGSAAPPAGFSAIDPILDYSRGSGTNQGTSVTGGVVYRGSKIPALHGAYIFADYVSGNIWSLFYHGTTASNWVRLTGTPGIAAFGTDPSNGDVLIADQGADTIKRLVFATVSGSPLPLTLADTGVFADTATLTPQPGVLAYDINLPSWSDGASKTRWCYFPTNRTLTFRATNNWTFPTGSVWIQHFEMELTNGVPESRQRIETRVLARDGASAIYGLTYRWDATQTNASLVPEGGFDEDFAINDGGTVRTQAWHYPGRSECLLCHTSPTLGGQALAFNTPQLNRDFNYGGVVDNQLRALANAGYFSAAPSNLHNLRALADTTDESVSVEQRVRSYLTANCVGCHQSGASGGNSFDARIFAPLPNTKLINGVLNNNGGDTNNRVIVPGALDRSMLLTRIATRGSGKMPPLDSSLVDTQAVALFHRWITNDLPGYRTFAQWQFDNFGSTNAAHALASADPDLDFSNNLEEYQTGKNPNDPADFWSIGIERNGDRAEVLYPILLNRGIEVQWNTNLTNGAWSFLNVPPNRPFFPGTNGTGRVPDATGNAPAKYYRARVIEP